MVVFDLSSDAKNFQRFIAKLRDDLRDQNNPTLVNGVARLTPQVDNPETVDIELRSGENVVTMRVRTDNLYVIGFMNGTNNWYEFAPENNRNRPHFIGGATWLSYNGSYTNNGIGSLNQEDDILGQPAVREAIQHLANFRGTTTADTRRHLRTLIVNFIETTRLDQIANIVGPQMSNPGATDNRRLRSNEITLIRRWSALSEALRNHVNNPAGPNPFRRFFDLGILNATDAARVLGMVLIGIVRACNTRRSRRSIADVAGLTLVEVIGVVVRNTDGEDPGDLYGTISITDGFGTTNLFSRDKSNTQSVGPGGWVDINWPAAAVDGADDFVFDVNLWDHDTISPDDQVAYGQATWNSHDTMSRDYDRVQSRRVSGKNGAVDVYFAVMTEAVVGTADVVMLDGDGEKVPDVYGKITASTGMSYCGERLDMKLFHRERSQWVGVPKATSIPLKRRVIPAPLSSVLQVSADLWDADAISSDDHIANGSWNFNPRLAGKDNGEINGLYGRVKVYFTWSI